MIANETVKSSVVLHSDWNGTDLPGWNNIAVILFQRRATDISSWNLQFNKYFPVFIHKICWNRAVLGDLLIYILDENGKVVAKAGTSEEFHNIGYDNHEYVDMPMSIIQNNSQQNYSTWYHAEKQNNNILIIEDLFPEQKLTI